jgi:predicted nucleic acid-binding protein
LELAAAGLFRAKWTEQIHEEWISSLLESRKDLTRAKLERTKQLMNTVVLDCLVENYEGLILALKLPDPDDRHVLAAAIHSHSDAIITFNLKDFPASALNPYQIEAQHPDEFIYHQFGLDRAAVLVAAHRVRARLRNPPKSAEDYLQSLESQGLIKTVDELSNYASIL